MENRILVATDGQAPSLGALRMAAALAARTWAEVHVVGVVEPFPVVGTGGTDIVATTWREIEHAGERALLQRVLDQLELVGAGAGGWPVTVTIGLPAPTIVQMADRLGASMIIAGLGRHELADRWFGTEMALRVMRLSHVPVLAVPASCTEPPRRALIAVDFTEFSSAAARTAARLVAPGGEIHLAHVMFAPLRVMSASNGAEWLLKSQDVLAEQLDELASSLAADPTCRFVQHVLAGDPAREILRLTEEIDADLVAAGSHGTGFFGRVLMGSVSTRLVRGATRSILISPPTTLPEEIAMLGERTVAEIATAGSAVDG
jgi:nucleotide-binding universal stress UspA family protein